MKLKHPDSQTCQSGNLSLAANMPIINSDHQKWSPTEKNIVMETLFLFPLGGHYTQIWL